jgi:hypothetical protein
MIKIIQMLNATRARLKNRRVIVITQKDGIVVRFKTLSSDSEPKAGHTHERGITTTDIKLTNEAAVALYLSLENELQKAGLLSHIKS